MKWLGQRGISVEVREIRETPPSSHELAVALRLLGGDRKKLLNIAGAEYRSMGLKDQIDTLSDEALFALIQQNGNLCKRPFLIDEASGVALTGFRVEQWEQALAG
jgi:arsenate reductase-like glutaredoxin family protein